MKILNKILNNPLYNELFRHSGGTFTLKILGQFLQIGSGIILARSLGAEGYGIYSYPIAIILLLCIPATIGLPQLIVKSISEYYTLEKYGLMKGLLIRANQFVFIISILFASGAAIVYFLIGGVQLSSIEGVTFALSLTLLPMLALKHVRMAALRGLRKVVIGQLPDIIIRPALFLLLVTIFFIVFKKNLSPEFVMILQVASTGSAFFIGSIFLVKNQPNGVKCSIAEYNTPIWLKSAIPFLFIGVMGVINRQTDVVMLGILRPASDVGVYRVAVHGSNLVTFVLGSINTALSPQIARLWTLNKKDNLQRVVTNSSRVIAIATFIASTVLVIGGRFLISVLFGEEFDGGITALRILCIGQIINGLTGSGSSVLSMTGNARKSAIAVGIGAVVNIVLNIILVPKFGTNGAAIATAISLATWNIIIVIWVRKVTGIKVTALGII